jgi:hypothetical protein
MPKNELGPNSEKPVGVVEKFAPVGVVEKGPSE